MWDNATIMMLVEGTFVTLYMTLVSTFMGYVLGLPMGIALVITVTEGTASEQASFIRFWM